jgi:hypothetical protein
VLVCSVFQKSDCSLFLFVCAVRQEYTPDDPCSYCSDEVMGSDSPQEAGQEVRTAEQQKLQTAPENELLETKEEDQVKVAIAVEPPKQKNEVEEQEKANHVGSVHNSATEFDKEAVPAEPENEVVQDAKAEELEEGTVVGNTSAEVCQNGSDEEASETEAEEDGGTEDDGQERLYNKAAYDGKGGENDGQSLGRDDEEMPAAGKAAVEVDQQRSHDPFSFSLFIH